MKLTQPQFVALLAVQLAVILLVAVLALRVVHQGNTVERNSDSLAALQRAQANQPECSAKNRKGCAELADRVVEALDATRLRLIACNVLASLYQDRSVRALRRRSLCPPLPPPPPPP